MYSFVYDAATAGDSSVLRLKSVEPEFSECVEYANGQFRPETTNTALKAYDTFKDLKREEMI